MSMPTAYEVGFAIVCAAHATGADPVMVASGERPRDHFDRQAVTRARIYAAIALHKFFGCKQSSIDRMVGARNVGSFVSAHLAHLKNKDLGWYDVEVERIILEVLAQAQADPPPPVQEMVQVEHVVVDPAEVDAIIESVEPSPAFVGSSLCGTPIKDIRSSLLYDAVRNTPQRVDD